MAGTVANPYWFDESDQEHCAICGRAITPPRRGPVPVYCARSECRRTGALRHKLAKAWEEGFAAARRRSAPSPIPTADRRHWATAFQAGALAAKLDARVPFSRLQTSISWYLHRPEADNLAALRRSLIEMRKSLRLGTKTDPKRPRSPTGRVRPRRAQDPD